MEGVQPAEIPEQVSRTYAFMTPFVTPAAKFVAEDRNATYRPSELLFGVLSALIAGATLSALPGVLPSVPTEMSVVEGVQPDVTPMQVSLTKTFCVVPGVSVLPSVEASTYTP